MSKKVREYVRFFIMLALVLGMLPLTAGATEATDIEGHWAESQIKAWVQGGLIKGYPDGTFKPNNNITRAEFMALVNGAFKYTEKTNISYSDVPATAWFADVVGIAKAAGYISGYADGTIRPNNPISRQEAAAIVAKIKALEQNPAAAEAFSDALGIPAWSKGAVGAVVAAEIMGGYPDGSFKAVTPLNRAEAVVILDKALKLASSADVSYVKSDTYGPAAGTETIKGNVVIKAKDVTLQNVVIKGNLIIDKAVDQGNATLKNVVVTGDTYVYGGGVNSIYVIDSELGKTYVLKDDGPVRIVVSGSSEVARLIAGSSIKLEEVDLIGQGIAGIMVEKKVDGKITLDLAGIKVDSLAIQSGDVTIITDNKTAIKALVVAADNVRVQTTQGTSIGTLVADGKVAVTGAGTIAKAEVNVKGVTWETKPGKIDTAPGVTAPSIGNTTGSGGGGGGGSPKVTVNAVRVKTAPAKVAYTAGDILDLTGLEVTLTKSDSTTEDVALAGFAAKGITTSPANGTVLTTANTAVIISHNASGKTASQAIVVNTKPITAIGKISGTAKVGEILTAGTLTPAGATATYQWQVCATSIGEFTNITGATDKTYIIAAGDVGKYLKVVATGTGNYSGTVISAATAEIAVKTVDIPDIQGVTVPVKGGTPVTAITETEQYTGTVTWDKPMDEAGKFAAGTQYVATITIAPKPGYTLTGVAENFFKVAGVEGTQVFNPSSSGFITATFPTTKSNPEVTFAFNGLDNAFASRELLFTVKSKITNNGAINSNTAKLRYKVVLKKDGNPAPNITINYTEGNGAPFAASFTTDQQGIAYFGPEGGISPAGIVDLIYYGVTTPFKVTLENSAEYSLTISLVDLEDSYADVGGAATKTFTVKLASDAEQAAFEAEQAVAAFEDGEYTLDNWTAANSLKDSANAEVNLLDDGEEKTALTIRMSKVGTDLSHYKVLLDEFDALVDLPEYKFSNPLVENLQNIVKKYTGSGRNLAVRYTWVTTNPDIAYIYESDDPDSTNCELVVFRPENGAGDATTTLSLTMTYLGKTLKNSFSIIIAEFTEAEQVYITTLKEKAAALIPAFQEYFPGNVYKENGIIPGGKLDSAIKTYDDAYYEVQKNVSPYLGNLDKINETSYSIYRLVGAMEDIIGFFDEYPDSTELYEDFHLPTTEAVGFPGITVKWESNNLNAMDSEGKVTRPASGENNAEVTLTLTLSTTIPELILKNDFKFTVLAITPLEEMTVAGVTAEDMKGEGTNGKVLVTWTPLTEEQIAATGADRYIINYVGQGASDHAGLVAVEGASNGSCEISGLRPGQAYDIYVNAHNQYFSTKDNESVTVTPIDE